MRGRVLILVGAVLLLAIGGIFFMMSSSDNGSTDNITDGTEEALVAENGLEEIVFETKDIIVAEQDIPRGSKINEQHLAVVSWPAEAIPDADDWNYFQADQYNELIGQIARTDIVYGSPIFIGQVVDDLADIAAAGSDAAAILPAGTVGIGVPLDPTGIGQVAYGIRDGDYVDVIFSFLYVDVDPEFQTRIPNTISVIGLDVETEIITILEPRPGRHEPSLITQFGNLIGPSEPAQRPRLVTQRTVQNAYVVHVGYFPESGNFIGATPTPDVLPTEPPPLPEDEGQQPEEVPLPSATPYSPRIITLAVSPQDALSLTWAIDAQIPITLALRPVGDAGITTTTPVTLDYMIQTYNAIPPNALEFALEPPISSVRRFDIAEMFNFLNEPAPSTTED